VKRLVSDHAEDVGGFMVEPGTEFDESDADSDVISRLDDEGKLDDVSDEAQADEEQPADKPTRKAKGNA
jgi:hypothetical protein